MQYQKVIGHAPTNGPVRRRLCSALRHTLLQNLISDLAFHARLGTTCDHVGCPKSTEAEPVSKCPNKTPKRVHTYEGGKGLSPHAWLTQTLERIAQGWPISQIDALMPWHFKA